jgi:hypothetical protein
MLIPAAAATGAEPVPPPQAGCEPDGDVGMQARVVSSTRSGKAAALLIEVSLDPHLTILDGVLEGARWTPSGAITAPGLDERLLTLLKGVPRKLLYLVDLPRDEDHHLLFTLRSHEPGAAIPMPSAYLLVSLDPSRRPERYGNYIQYVAVSEGR